MTPSLHRVTQHASVLAGVEALTLLTDRGFPRHCHAGFGLGLVDHGAQRSWEWAAASVPR